MPFAPPLDAVPEQPARRYTWLLAFVIAVGLGGSLSISYTLYRTAERQWIAHADSSAERLSTVLLGWIQESYSTLSGLAASPCGTLPRGCRRPGCCSSSLSPRWWPSPVASLRA